MTSVYDLDLSFLRVTSPEKLAKQQLAKYQAYKEQALVIIRKTGIYVTREVPRDKDGFENEEAFFNDATFQIETNKNLEKGNLSTRKSSVQSTPDSFKTPNISIQSDTPNSSPLYSEQIKRGVPKTDPKSAKDKVETSKGKKMKETEESSSNDMNAHEDKGTDEVLTLSSAMDSEPVPLHFSDDETSNDTTKAPSPAKIQPSKIPRPKKPFSSKASSISTSSSNLPPSTSSIPTSSSISSTSTSSSTGKKSTSPKVSPKRSNKGTSNSEPVNTLPSKASTQPKSKSTIQENQIQSPKSPEVQTPAPLPNNSPLLSLSSPPSHIHSDSNDIFASSPVPGTPTPVKQKKKGRPSKNEKESNKENTKKSQPIVTSPNSSTPPPPSSASPKKRKTEKQKSKVEKKKRKVVEESPYHQEHEDAQPVVPSYSNSRMSIGGTPQAFGRPVRKRGKPVAFWKNEVPDWYVPVEKINPTITPTTGARKKAERIATKRRLKEKDELD